MNPTQLARRLEKIRRDMLIYKEQWPRTTGKIALDWVHENFDKESYRHNVMIPWKKLKKSKDGKKLIRSGKLKASIKMRAFKAHFKIYTFNKYARVHNDGFKGTVQVRAHQRRKKLSGTIGDGISYGANSSIRSRKRLKDKAVYQTSEVQAHKRKMNVPRRQFMPSAARGSNMLVTEIKKKTEKDIQKILKQIR